MGRTSDARERLMEAANALIWEHSYGAVTIEAICEKAAVRKGSFYYFFDSKSDLAIAAVGDWWRARKGVLEEVFQSTHPPLERLRRYVDMVADWQMKAYQTNGQILGCPLFTLGTEISTQDEQLRLLIKGILDEVNSYFEQVVRDAQLLGEIGGGNASSKARALFTYYEGLLCRARIENNPDALRTLGSDVLEAIGAQGALTVG